MSSSKENRINILNNADARLLKGKLREVVGCTDKDLVN
jgi:hypothetical protein